MLDQQTLKQLGTFFATGGVKMFLEAPYNELFKSEFGKRLKQLGIAGQTGLVTALGLLTFFLQKELHGDHPINKVLEDVLVDAWPEFSKRLFNGYTDFLVKRPTGVSTNEQATVAKLSQLSQADFQALLTDLLQAVQEKAPQPKSSSLDQVTKKIQTSRQHFQQIRKRGVLW